MQYYDDSYPTIKDQKEFEKNLFNKTHRANGRLNPEFKETEVISWAGGPYREKLCPQS